jgi:hypothetical protein
MRSLKRILVPLAGTASVLTFAILARGHAPPDQYDTFGSQAQFIDDPHTHLTWQRVLDSNSTDQQSALAKCASSGQRLPTYRELLTIVDEDPHDEWDPESGAPIPRYIDPDAFPGTPPAAFWTMSPGAGNNKPKFKVVDFGDGTTTELSSSSTAFYRCVSDD